MVRSPAHILGSLALLLVLLVLLFLATSCASTPARYRCTPPPDSGAAARGPDDDSGDMGSIITPPDTCWGTLRRLDSVTFHILLFDHSELYAAAGGEPWAT